MLYVTDNQHKTQSLLCYQDFKDTFVCNTQHQRSSFSRSWVVLSGFQRYFCMQYTTLTNSISMSPLLCYQDFKDTFVCNTQQVTTPCKAHPVVLSGFQRYFCMQYTTYPYSLIRKYWLCYQDFKDTFVCNTQPTASASVSLPVVLSGFQRYFCMQYTTADLVGGHPLALCYQDFKDTFVCNTQHRDDETLPSSVVLSGFQRYFCMQYTTT